MRTYATVRGTFWVRGSGKKLRGNPEAQVLAMYLMTCCQGTLCGLFSIALPTIAHETGIDEERLPGLFKDISEIAVYDADEEVCWVPNAAREQVGERLSPKDKRRTGLMRELKQFEGHRFHRDFINLYQEAYSLDPLPEEMPKSASPLQESREGMQQPLRSPGHGHGHGHGHEQVESGGAGGDPEPETEPEDPPIPCPADLKLTEAQATNREMAGCPRWAQEQLTRSFVGRYLADAKDRRPLTAWLKCLDVAIGATWSDPGKRPKRDDASAPSVTEAERQQSTEAYERHLKRQRERNRRLLEQSNG